MSTVAADESAASVQGLYTRYKSLAISASAAIMLEQPTAELRREIDELLESARTGCDGSPITEACVEAAETLRRLVLGAESGGPTEASVAAARTAHSQLRAEVWSTHPCEYVPCCAGHPERG